jgi:hypothetical protein
VGVVVGVVAVVVAVAVSVVVKSVNGVGTVVVSPTGQGLTPSPSSRIGGPAWDV